MSQTLAPKDLLFRPKRTHKKESTYCFRSWRPKGPMIWVCWEARLRKLEPRFGAEVYLPLAFEGVRVQNGSIDWGYFSYTPQCTSIKGLMVSIRWYLGSLKG